MGNGAAPRPGVHLRQDVLVVQHVQHRRLGGHAAADLSGRRPQGRRHLLAARGSARSRSTPSIGAFPFFNFWGPQADIRSSQWIADASMLRRSSGIRRRCCWSTFRTSTTTCSASGPDDRADQSRRPRDRRGLRHADRALPRSAAAASSCCRSTGWSTSRDRCTSTACCAKPGLLAVRDELGTDALDPGASEAFAVPIIRWRTSTSANPSRIAEREGAAERLPGIEQRARSRRHRRTIGLDHERSGELVAIAAADRVVHVLLLAG